MPFKPIVPSKDPRFTAGRPQASSEAVDKVIEEVSQKLYERLERKGWGIFMSSHEIFGILDEEFDELGAEVRVNYHAGCIRELKDIAVAAIFGIVSLRDGRMDWPHP